MPPKAWPAKRGSRAGKQVRRKRLTQEGGEGFSAEQWSRWYQQQDQEKEEEEQQLVEEQRLVEERQRSRSPSRSTSLVSSAEQLRIAELEREVAELRSRVASSSPSAAHSARALEAAEEEEEGDGRRAYSVPFEAHPFPTRDPLVESLSSSSNSRHSRASTKSEEVVLEGPGPLRTVVEEPEIVLETARPKSSGYRLQLDAPSSKAAGVAAYRATHGGISPPVPKAAVLRPREPLQPPPIVLREAARGSTDFRVAEGRVFGEYVPRDFERAREAPEPATSSRPERWLTDTRQWPVQTRRHICIDYHGVLQIRRSGRVGRGQDRWYVPALHVEILRNLIRLGWAITLISWVGSDRRLASTHQEILDSGIADALGRRDRDWYIIQGGQRSDKIDKALQCGCNVVIDDSSEVIEAARRADLYTIPINGGETHPDGYRDLAQALAVERILFRGTAPDR